MTYSDPNPLSSLGNALLGNCILGGDPAGLVNYRRPRAHREPDLGPNQIDWIRRRGWLDGPRVTRIGAAEGAAAYRKAEMQDVRATMDRRV